MARTDRRVDRTRERLQTALIELIGERGYDAVTIQDIVGRAGVGRTTFYLHYRGKDDLFIGCHEAIVREFRIGPLHPLSRQDLLAAEAPPGVRAAFDHLREARSLLRHVFEGRDSLLILRRLRERNAQEIEAALRNAFGEVEARIPLEVVSNYLAGAQIALVQWWLQKRQPHTLEILAQSFHRLQRAAILDALGPAPQEAQH